MEDRWNWAALVEAEAGRKMSEGETEGAEAHLLMVVEELVLRRLEGVVEVAEDRSLLMARARVEVAEVASPLLPGC